MNVHCILGMGGFQVFVNSALMRRIGDRFYCLYVAKNEPHTSETSVQDCGLTP